MNLNKQATGAKVAMAADPMNELRLAAARKRLAESLDEEDAIEGLREIVANLLGCEEIGLFKVDPDGKSFSVCWSFGADLENYDLLKALGDSGRQQIMRGQCHVGEEDRDRTTGMAKGQAFVPIRVANQTVGILAILRLLPQKAAFDAHDMELFKLLSEEAATPLFPSISQSINQAKGVKKHPGSKP
jgi:GAF domain-containing protein